MHRMYSGSDSTESQKYRQWALNPSAYQNMASDQVDWAALAQQWIIMKEAGPPPIPGEQPVVLNTKSTKEVPREGGEAPMEMENDKEEVPAWNVSEPPPPPGAEPWNWNPQSQNWNWNNSWIPPSAVPPPPTIGPLKPPLLPTPNSVYSAPPESSNDNAVPFGNYNTSSNSEYNSGYWSNSSSHKHIKPHNKRYSKVNVPIRAPAPIPPITVPVETPVTPILDASKRKQLPAWIREGLEKMEKDKLKQLEKEREKQERDEYLEKNKQNEKETMEILKSTMKERQRSKFESDGENSDYESHRKRSRASPERISLTHDELMLKVRRLMTEILLNVTSRQIEAICKEEHQRYMKKYKASDQRSSAPSGANISARLGLGIYGEGSGSSSEGEEEEYQRDSRDSDTELKDTIKRKMADFQKTEREIEDKLEEAERKKAGSISRSSSPESNDNDSQVDARVQGRRHHSDDMLSPRSRNFHDKSSKPRSFSSSSDGSDYSNNRSKNSRRSSSSDSNTSHKRSKKKRRSRSDSQSPDKKHKSNLSSRWSRSKSPAKRHSRSDSGSRRDSTGSKKKSRRSRSRSRSRSYSRSRRSRSSSYRRSKRSRSRDRSRRSRSRNRSSSRSRYSKRSRSSSRSDSRRSRRKRSRSSSDGRGKRSHRN